MSSDVSSDETYLIRAVGIGKSYASDLTAARLLRYLSPWPMRPKPDDFWALQNVSFTIRPGSVLGIIGRNGSGKSTILQIVAGLLEPSEGQMEVRGKISALLELGAGFNPEFTGRENIYLSGSVHGHSRTMMEQRFDDIVSFADIGPHLDQAVKTYSSGMFARLAFAVAIQVDPEILIVDEILSVGDLGFQAQCFSKIEQLRATGTSILFVSHDLNAVQMLCDHVILLDEGKVVAQGRPKDVTNRYISLLSERGQSKRNKATKDSGLIVDRAAIHDIRFTNSKGQETIHPFSGERCKVRYRVVFTGDVERPVVTLQFKTMLGLVVADHTSIFANKVLPPSREGDELLVTFDLELNLCPGPFRVGVSVAELLEDGPISLFGRETMTIEVLSEKQAYGLAYLKSDISIEQIKGYLPLCRKSR